MNTTAISIFLGVAIFTLAVIIRTGWRPSRPNVHWGWIVGVLGVLLLLAITGGIRGCIKKSQAEEVAKEKARQEAIAFAKANPIIVEFPISGEGHATKQVGLKAWLDPTRTYTRPSRAVRYVFVEDTEVFFDDIGPGINSNNNKEWLNMPAGKYIVYPLKGDRIYFRWWQGNERR